MSSSIRSACRPLAAGLVLLGLAALVYAPLLAPSRAPYSPYSDVLAEHLALKQLGYASWSRHGSLPLWRDDQFSGSPALTNPQALYLHPLHVAFLCLPPSAAIGPTFVLQFFVAALGCYALARALGASWLASLFSGSAGLVAFKPILAAHAGWLAPLATLALVPWLLAGLLRLAERPSRARCAQLALIGAVAFAGGSPQLLYYAGLLGAPCVFMAGFDGQPRPNLLPALRSLALAAGALGLGLACNAYFWSSIASEWSWIARTQESHDYAFFLSGHGLGLDQLWTLLQPHVFGVAPEEPWEENAYFGWVPLSLALFAAYSAPARSIQRYFSYALLASVLLSLDSPLLQLAYVALPGYDGFRLPGRMLFLTSYLGIALAGPGLDRVLRHSGDRAWMRAAAALALMLAVTLEGGHYARMYLTTTPRSQLLPDASHPARLLATRPGGAGARTAIAGRSALNYGWSADLGLRLVNGYDPYNYTHYKRFMALLDLGESVSPAGNWVDIRHLARPDLLDEIAVRYVIAGGAIPLPQFELLAHPNAVRNFVLYGGMVRRPLFIYENRSARPYARFARSVQQVASVEDQLAEARLTGQAYVREALPAIVVDAQARVRIERLAAGRVAVRTDARTPQLLVLAEVFHPGWRARVDGREAQPLQVNLALLGVWLDAGTHRVELEFVPLHFARSVGISLLALGLLLGWLGFEAMQGMRRARTQT